MKNKVYWTVIKSDGRVEKTVSDNLRVNDGTNWQVNRMFDASLSMGTVDRIGVTENTDAPASGNTNLVDEEAADGLTRTQGTLAHTADQSLATLSVEMQYTGSSVKTVAKACLAIGATNLDTSADTHFAMTLVSPVAVLDSNDTLAIDWGVDI